MNNTPTKRMRCSNFSKEDQLLLIEEIRKFKSVIENKVTNKISCNEKQEAWKKIEESFNSKVSARRSVQQLVSKYENLKTEARKTVAQRRQYMMGTGGGPSYTSEIDPVLLAVLQLVNMKTVVGLQSNFDGDFTINVSRDINTDTGLDVSSTPLIKIHESQDNNSNDIDAEQYLSEPVSITIQNGEVMNTVYEDTCTPPSQSTKNYSPTTREITDAGVKSVSDNDWGSYVPRKLKKPVRKSLRPKLANPVVEAKAEYYKMKKILVEKQIEQNQREHEKKMLLLDMEIEKKKHN